MHSGFAIPESLLARARELEPIGPDERRHLLREESALLVDALLVQTARGQGALDVAIGQGLDAVSSKLMHLGYSCIGDYVRERLGMAVGTAKAKARLARALRTRPLLAKAVRTGAVSARNALEVLPVAKGEEEAAWVERARTSTVNALQQAVRAAREGLEPEPTDEEFETLWMVLGPDERKDVKAAFKLAGKVLGANAPRWERLQAICMETLSAVPFDEPGDNKRVVDTAALRERVGALRADLEQLSNRWSVLTSVDGVATPEVAAQASAFELDETLRDLAALRRGWDESFGRLALLVKMNGLWRDMQFASFGHYCAERLGMGETTVAQRISLERKLYDFPSLRIAMREGRISYEKARLLARHATQRTIEEWIARAEKMTCIDLRRTFEAEEEAQICSRNELEVVVPKSVTAIFSEACRAVRAAIDRNFSPGECLGWMARHFLEVWAPLVRKAKTPTQKARERDVFCQVPGCSKLAAHGHHVTLSSQGGGDDPKNLVGMCGFHHLFGVHLGLFTVVGEAPDKLFWAFGLRGGKPPLWTFESKARLEALC